MSKTDEWGDLQGAAINAELIEMGHYQGEPYPQTEDAWAELRARLCTQYPEDQVQETLLHLLEKMAKGEPLETEPIYWCRMDAAHDIVDGRKTRALQQALCESQLPLPTSEFPSQEARLEIGADLKTETRTVPHMNRIHAARRYRVRKKALQGA